jgi:hypothetical protein
MAIPSDDQWRLVFDRYTGQIAERVRGFGGDPDLVEPSPDGTGVDKADAHCSWLYRFYILLLAMIIILASAIPMSSYLPESLSVLGLIAATVIWLVLCKVTRCRWVMGTILGLGIGAAGTALLVLFGLSSQGERMLILAALLLGVAMGLGILWRCFRYKDK